MSQPSPDKKVYLHITSLEKKTTIGTKAKSASISFAKKAHSSLLHVGGSVKKILAKRKHFAAVQPEEKIIPPQNAFLKGLGRSGRELRRNPFRSIATVFIMALVLTTIGTAIFVSFITEQAIKIVNEKLDISIEVQNSAALDQVQDIVKELQVLPSIRHVTYISKNDALANFRADHPELTDFLDTYEINNPLPATLRINVDDPKNYQQVINFLDREEYSTLVDLNKARANFSERGRIEQLVTITDTIKYFLYFFISLFIGIGILIIVATVQLTLQQRRRELSIMQVVGASFKRILSPFIWETIILSVLSTIAAFLILAAVSAKLTPFATQYFDSESVNVTKYLQINILPFTLILLGSAVGISLIVTLLTVWKNLRSQKLF